MECRLVSLNEENCNVVGKIVNCAVDESAMTDGKPDAAKMKPICFDTCQHVYRPAQTSSPADELGNMWGAYDCGLASSYFVLAAKNRGWDTPIMGIRDTAKVKSILGIPAGETLMSIIAVGNAAV